MTESADQNSSAETSETKNEKIKKEESVKEATGDISKKNNAFQARRREPLNPTECASCGKHLIKRLWYYRNNAYYCSKTCFHKKARELKDKALEEQNRNKEEKEKGVGVEKS